MAMLRSLCFSLALIVATSTFADEPNVLKVWPGKPPGPQADVDGPEHDRQKPEDRKVGGKTVMKITNIADAQIHVYQPSQDTANGAAVVICPGGGYNILAWDLEGTEVAEWLNSIGVTGVVLKYRAPTGSLGDPGKWQGPVMDGQRAVSLVRSHAKEWNLDPERIGVLGFSAGGNLAAHVTTENGNRLYEPVDKVDEASCAPNFSLLIYPAYIVAKDGSLNPEFKVDKQTPPVFFAHAADDPITCLSSIVLSGELKKAGVPTELHVYRSGGHGYGLRPTEQAVTLWPERAGAWLQESGFLSGKK